MILRDLKYIFPYVLTYCHNLKRIQLQVLAYFFVQLYIIIAWGVETYVQYINKFR